MKRVFAVIVGGLCLIVIAAVSIYVCCNASNTVVALELLESRLRGNGTFIDYDQAICANSIKDFGWWKKRGTWYIAYGKIELELTPKQLKDVELVERLERLGIVIRGTVESGNLSFYWRDEEIAEWVPR